MDNSSNTELKFILRISQNWAQKANALLIEI